MKLSELPCLSFKAMRQRFADQTPSGSPYSGGERRQQLADQNPSGGERRPMVEPTDDSDFCHTAVESGWLTTEQMTHAAMHYKLGRSRSGKTIFWMIDEWGKVRDGRIGEGWASVMFRQRAPDLLKSIPTTHCLFGQHLLLQEPDKEVCIVESERSAVVLSEVMPECIWLATMYPMNLNVTSFEPLQGRSVMLYPKTDPVGDHYLAWLELADQARRLYDIQVGVNDLLEEKATPGQKEHHIDLVDFLFSH